MNKSRLVGEIQPFLFSGGIDFFRLLPQQQTEKIVCEFENFQFITVAEIFIHSLKIEHYSKRNLILSFISLH